VNVLAVDIGGTHVKILATGQKEPRRFPSGPELTPKDMVAGVKKLAQGWKYDAVSIGYPGPVIHGRVVSDPHNLGKGWVAFDFGKEFGKLDFLVHSVAFAPREELTGQFVNTTRKGFATALDVSAYSLIAVTRAAAPLMTDGGSVVTLTYLGSERVVPHYNVMGVAKAALESSVRYLAHDLGPKNIRVNAISAGPIRTLAARGVAGISKMVDHHREFAPLRHATEQSECGDTALFLLSSLGRGITGEVIYVDGGYHILGSLLSTE